VPPGTLRHGSYNRPNPMKRKLKTHQKLLVATMVAIAGLLMLAVGVYAYDQSQEDQIAPGIKVGGVEIGGRSVQEARQVVDDEIVAPLQKPVVVSFEGETYKLPAKQLNQRADVESVIDEAVERTREGGLVDRVTRYVQGSAVNVNLDPNLSYDDVAVGRFIARVAGNINQEAQDASIEPSTDRLVPTPGKPGRALREEELADAVLAEVEAPGAGEPIAAQVDITRPEVTTKELAREYPTYVTVSQSEYKLRLFKNLKLVKEYPIAVGGSGYPTPTGLHSIADKQVDPTWNVPTSSWAGDLAGQSIPPGPSNPLKERWMGIYNGAGIHGTDDTGSIGSSASHGCIRMLIPDVVELYDKVDVGTPIYIE
jgi:lipoprotein-anchoring transpeptidase ErfK/SrfK